MKRTRPYTGESEEVEPKRRKLSSEVVGGDTEIKENNERPRARAARGRGGLFANLLQGTLKQFEKETKQTSEGLARRKEVEAKIDKTLREERERMQAEKERRIAERRQAQEQRLREQDERKRAAIERRRKQAEKKMVTTAFEVTKQAHENSLEFIKTKAKPPIFYLPALHTERTRALLEESRSRSGPVMLPYEEVEEDTTVISRKYGEEDADGEGTRSDGSADGDAGRNVEADGPADAEVVVGNEGVVEEGVQEREEEGEKESRNDEEDREASGDGVQGADVPAE